MLRPSEVIPNFAYNPSQVVSLDVTAENIPPVNTTWQNASGGTSTITSTNYNIVMIGYYLNINFKNASKISIPFITEDEAKNALKELLTEINDALFEIFNTEEHIKKD